MTEGEQQSDGGRVIPCVGDSHCVVLHGYRGKDFIGRFKSIPATGLKAGHVRLEVKDVRTGGGRGFYTFENLKYVLSSLDVEEREAVVLSAGEIDCREGVGGVLCTGYINGEVEGRDIEDGVRERVGSFLEGLEVVRRR